MSKKRARNGCRTTLSRRQTERDGKSFWDAEEFDRQRTRYRGARIASGSLLPVETIMRPLRTGQGRRRDRWAGRTAGFHLHLHPLVRQQVDARPSMVTTTPIPPEYRSRADDQWMEQHADLARLCCGVAIPLTLLAQRTGAATANAGGIDHTQTAIGFSTPLMGRKRLPCWTPQRPIGLERKILPREAACFPRRVAVAGGPYPDTGPGEAVACSLTEGMAAANSVMRMGVGSN